MDLAPFSSVDVSALRWIRLAPDRPEYELRSGEVPLVRLAWSNGRGGTGTATTATGAWVIRREGFAFPRLHLRDVGATRDSARIVSRLESLHLRYGIDLRDAAPGFTLARAGLTVPAWTVLDAAGEEVAHIEPVRDGRHLLGGIYEVEGSLVRSTALPVVVTLSWCLISLAWLEDEAVAEWTDHAESQF